MHIHCFQHDHFEDLGYIGEWAKDHNFTTSVTRFDLNPEFPAHHDYDWLVVLGGKMSVKDTDEFPWMLKEIDFIKEAISLGKIVIGICLGAQLVASALGARVYRNTDPEMGFWPVTFSQKAANDSVFRHFPAKLDVLHVHFDTFTLPENAVKMADSEITHCQAFRYGENVFAFQFHFEVSPQNVTTFVHEVAPELVKGKYCQTASHILSLSICCERNNTIFEKILNEICSVKL